MKRVVDLCPLCGYEHHEPFETFNDGSFTLTYQMCSNCGLVFQSPCMDSHELARFYVSGYRQSVQGTEEPTNKDLRIQAGRARHQLQLLKPIVPTVSRHLDIGSSSGAFLKMLSGHYGCESIGIEPGDIYRKRSSADGLEVYAELANIEPKYRGSFDLISMSHVLEHLLDPFTYLTQLREQWMTPEGHLLIEVPNLFGHQSVELSHLVLFSPHTLHQMLVLTGFEVLRMFTHGNPRSPLLRLYITVIGRVGSNDRDPSKLTFSSRGVRTRRILGMWMKDFLSHCFPRWTWRSLPNLENGIS
jgi:SAM-dependent methyltransferase